MPRFLIRLMLVMAVIGLVPAALVARARVAHMKSPRLHVVFDMDQQAKYEAQEANAAFADGRAMRTPVPGTVARGELHEDTWFYEGRVDGEFAKEFPFEITPLVMERGRERFGIFCAPCHGFDGYGKGLVSVRALGLEEGTWVEPTNYHTDEIRGRAPGDMFETITNGIRNMPPYRSQIPPEDRWAIIAYVRALQRSQNAAPADVPPEHMDKLR